MFQRSRSEERRCLVIAVFLALCLGQTSEADVKGAGFHAQDISFPRDVYLTGLSTDQSLSTYITGRADVPQGNVTFLSKIGPLGTVLWTNAGTAPSLSNVSVDTLGNTYSSSASDYFGLVSYDSNGIIRWSNSSVLVGSVRESLVLPSSFICAAGPARDTMGGQQESTLTVACWSSSGSLQWTNRTDHQEVYGDWGALEPDGTGGVFAASMIKDSTEIKVLVRHVGSSGQTMWSRVFGTDLRRLGEGTLTLNPGVDGSVVVTTCFYEFAIGPSLTAARFSAAGDLLLEVHSSLGHQCEGGIVGPSGHVYLCGRTPDSMNSVLAEYDSNGILVHSYLGTPFPATGSAGRRIKPAAQGGIVMACDALDNTGLPTDQGLAWFDCNCTLASSNLIGSQPFDPVDGITRRELTVDPQGRVIYGTSIGQPLEPGHKTGVFRCVDGGLPSMLAEINYPMAEVSITGSCLGSDHSVFVAGHTTESSPLLPSAGYVWKSGSDGSVIWSRFLNGGEQTVLTGGCIATSDGGVVVARSNKVNGTGNTNIYLDRLSSTGAKLWTSLIQVAGYDLIVNGVTPCLTGGYFVYGGAFPDNRPLYCKVNASGVVEWKKVDMNSGFKQVRFGIGDSRGFLYVCGTKATSDPLQDDFYVFEIAENGTNLVQRYVHYLSVVIIQPRMSLLVRSGHLQTFYSTLYQGQVYLTATQYTIGGNRDWGDAYLNDPNGSILSTADIGQGRTLVGTGFQCFCFDSTGAKLWSKPHNGPAAMRADGLLAVASRTQGGDGIYRLRLCTLNSAGDLLQSQTFVTSPAVDVTPSSVMPDANGLIWTSCGVDPLHDGAEAGLFRTGLAKAIPTPR